MLSANDDGSDDDDEGATFLEPRRQHHKTETRQHRRPIRDDLESTDALRARVPRAYVVEPPPVLAEEHPAPSIWMRLVWNSYLYRVRMETHRSAVLVDRLRASLAHAAAQIDEMDAAADTAHAELSKCISKCVRCVRNERMAASPEAVVSALTSETSPIARALRGDIARGVALMNRTAKLAHERTLVSNDVRLAERAVESHLAIIEANTAQSELTDTLLTASRALVTPAMQAANDERRLEIFTLNAAADLQTTVSVRDALARGGEAAERADTARMIKCIVAEFFPKGEGDATAATATTAARQRAAPGPGPTPARAKFNVQLTAAVAGAGGGEENS